MSRSSGPSHPTPPARGSDRGEDGTGSHIIYARLGWVVWQGPTWIRERDGHLRRSPDEDGDIMVRLTPMTPPGLDLSLGIAVDWRQGEVW